MAKSPDFNPAQTALFGEEAVVDRTIETVRINAATGGPLKPLAGTVPESQTSAAYADLGGGTKETGGTNPPIRRFSTKKPLPVSRNAGRPADEVRTESVDLLNQINGIHVASPEERAAANYSGPGHALMKAVLADVQIGAIERKAGDDDIRRDALLQKNGLPSADVYGDAYVAEMFAKAEEADALEALDEHDRTHLRVVRAEEERAAEQAHDTGNTDTA